MIFKENEFHFKNISANVSAPLHEYFVQDPPASTQFYMPNGHEFQGENEFDNGFSPILNSCNTDTNLQPHQSNGIVSGEYGNASSSTPLSSHFNFYFDSLHFLLILKLLNMINTT